MNKLNELSDFLETQINKLMETKVSESIWSNQHYTIPMAEVSHIEKMPDCKYQGKNRIKVIFKHSRYNDKTQDFEPNVYLNEEIGSVRFKQDWCYYRMELEGNIKEAGI